MDNFIGASANMYYAPAGSTSTGHGFFPTGAAGGVVPGPSPPLRTLLVKQIEYYFRQNPESFKLFLGLIAYLQHYDCNYMLSAKLLMCILNFISSKLLVLCCDL